MLEAELPQLFLYVAGAFMAWAMKRLVDQLDRLETRVRRLELRDASRTARLQMERDGDLEAG